MADKEYCPGTKAHSTTTNTRHHMVQYDHKKGQLYYVLQRVTSKDADSASAPSHNPWKNHNIFTTAAANNIAAETGSRPSQKTCPCPIGNPWPQHIPVLDIPKTTHPLLEHAPDNASIVANIQLLQILS